LPQIFDIEQAVLLLELEPPFDKREVQLARRRMAKRWHPDIAPPGRQHEHERHLKAINEAADQLEQIAEESRGGKVSRNAVKVSAAAARKRRAEEGARAYAEEQRQREQAADQARHDPFRSRVPDHSVVHRYARCLSYPEWGVGTVSGIYFTGDGDDVQQWARVNFHVGVRTVPAGSLQFVDFSKPDPAAERVQRFMTAAKHALAEGDFALAARRLVYARDAEPRNTQVLRLMTLAFWQAGNYPAAARAVRDWAREDGDRPAPHRYAARIYEDMGSLSLAVDAAEREVAVAPEDGSAWERLGRLRLRRFDRAGARDALERARALAPTEQGLLDLALVANLAGDVGAEVSACEQATQLAPESEAAWSRYAHALARTDRTAECLAACERALALFDDPEVRDLREQVLAMAPRELSSESAAA
jgi:tetratricopeptide (TPR) repeat protein